MIQAWFQDQVYFVQKRRRGKQRTARWASVKHEPIGSVSCTEPVQNSTVSCAELYRSVSCAELNRSMPHSPIAPRALCDFGAFSAKLKPRLPATYQCSNKQPMRLRMVLMGIFGNNLLVESVRETFWQPKISVHSFTKSNKYLLILRLGTCTQT